MFHRVVLSVERGRISFHRVALCVVWGCCVFRAGGGAGVCEGENSPCSACWQQKRDKTLPARAKRAKLGDFGRVGRVLYRDWWRVGRAGRVLYRDWWRAGRAGRVLYRNRGPQLARGKCCADCPPHSVDGGCEVGITKPPGAWPGGAGAGDGNRTRL